MMRKSEPKKVRALKDEDLDAVSGGAVEKRNAADDDKDARRAGFEVHGFINTDDPAD